ncbi:MAG: glycogen synthase GlgA [Betaproteobacteria bacterium]
MAGALRVLFVTPECAPLVKVGGLGDVSAALPVALRAIDVDVRVLLPGYANVMARLGDAATLASLEILGHRVRLLDARLASGVPLIVVDCPALFQRSGDPYQDEAGADWPDNAARFGVLSKAAAALGSASTPLGWQPDVVHLNDWPAALAAAYLHYGHGPRSTSIVTIHNLAFQGNFEPGVLPHLQLPPQSYAPEGLEFHGQVSFLKAGLCYADRITTVSPTYAQEIQREATGAGMHDILRHRSPALTGIQNGIDTGEWDPAADSCLPAHYTAGTLTRKADVKRALASRLGLTEISPDVPLLGFVGRLTHQKGADLLVAAAPDLLAMDVRMVVLGTGTREQEDALRALADRYPGMVSVTLGFDEPLAHLIEGGADLFIMPSRFEPCGLNQMYSQRYGTPPVAHATGGLVDTIADCTEETLRARTATGFLFREPSARALIAAVERALAVYRVPDRWRSLQRSGMARDFSWTRPARQYAALYRQLAARDRD